MDKPTRHPRVKIGPSKTLIGRPVPTRIAEFSSRGPSPVAPAILKVSFYPFLAELNDTLHDSSETNITFI